MRRDVETIGALPAQGRCKREKLIIAVDLLDSPSEYATRHDSNTVDALYDPPVNA